MLLIFISQKEGGKKSLLSLENITMGSKGMQEMCPTYAATGQQDCSADAEVLSTWEPGITEGCDPSCQLENKAHSLPRSFTDTWRQQRRLGDWCCSWGLLLSLSGSDQLAAWSRSVLPQACLCPLSLPWRNQNWCPLSILLPFLHFLPWYPILLHWL